jgi:hypothetical protein
MARARKNRCNYIGIKKIFIKFLRLIGAVNPDEAEYKMLGKEIAMRIREFI